jgi:hypothetical protein
MLHSPKLLEVQLGFTADVTMVITHVNLDRTPITIW